MLGQSRPYRDRWVYVSTGLDSDQESGARRGVLRARRANMASTAYCCRRASYAMDLKSPESPLTRITRLKQTCDHLGVEIIPSGFWRWLWGRVLIA